MKRRTVGAGVIAGGLAGTAVFFDELARFVRADARDAVSLDVVPDVLTSDESTATATVENNALVPVRTNLAAWKVHHDGELVVPDGWVQPLHRLAPGESHEYMVRLGGEPTEIGYSDSTVWLGDVDPGRYVFRLDVGVDERSRTLEASFRVESSE